MRKRSSSRLTVRRKPGHPTRGWLTIGPHALPVALGRGGIRANKREGDGGTPRGTFRPLRLWWRADKYPRPVTDLPLRAIRPADRQYTRPVKVPSGSAADRLARADSLYDFIVEIDHNTRPRVAGRGSAVFIHVARPGFAPTAGCIALATPALRRLLALLGPRTRIVVE